MHIEDIIQAKKEKRSFYRKKRKDISKAQKETVDKVLFEKIISLKEFRKSRVILAYYPINDDKNGALLKQYFDAL